MSGFSGVKIIEDLPAIKDNTKKTYAQVYRRVIREIFNDIEPSNLGDPKTIDKLIEGVNNDNKYSLGVQKSMFDIWKIVTKAKNQMTDRAEQKLYNEINSNMKANKYEPKKKELENLISLSDVVAKREEWKAKINDNFTTADIYYLLLSLYTMLAPLRSQDYTGTKVDPDNNDGINYYDSKNKQLIIRNYKTEKTHGERIIDIPAKLHKIIMDFQKKSKGVNNDKWLICRTTGTQLESVAINKMFASALGRSGISSSMMRKIYISESLDNGIMTKQKREKDAIIMGHSVATQQNVYSRFSKSLKEKDDLTISELLILKKQLKAQIKDIDARIKSKKDALIKSKKEEQQQ